MHVKSREWKMMFVVNLGLFFWIPCQLSDSMLVPLEIIEQVK